MSNEENIKNKVNNDDARLMDESVEKEVNTNSEKFINVHKTTERKRIIELRKRRLRNIIINTVSVTICLIGIYFLGHLFWRNYQYETTNDAMIDQYVTPLNIRVSGYIQSVGFTEHQSVKKGDTLVVLDDIEYRIKLREAEASLLDAEASAEVLKESIEIAKTNINVMNANLLETKAKVSILQTDYNRYKNLSEQGSIPQQQFDKATAEYESMKAHYNALQKQSDMAVFQSQEMEKKMGNAQAHILHKKAEYDMAKLNLSYTVVTAPFDGIVGRRTLENGQYVQAGQVLTYLINENDKWVTANYKETQIANIYIGQQVRIKVDAFPYKIFYGKVATISGATGSKYSLIPTDNSAGNFVKIQQRIPVRIDFQNVSKEDKFLLRAGMMVETEAVIKK